MNSIVCKPCFAFEALAAIVFNGSAGYGGVRSHIDIVKELFEKHFLNVIITPSNSYFDLFTSNYSFEEIEKLDLKGFIEDYSRCIKGNEFEDQFIKGFKILEDMNFTHIWDEYTLPFLQKQCDTYNAILKNEQTLSVLADVQKLKPFEKIDNVTIYQTYFAYPVSFYLSPTSYLTNHHSEDENDIDLKGVLRMFAHELIHCFSSDELRIMYRQTSENDDFLSKSRYVLFNKKGSPSDEEEFVVALEHFISYRNNLISKEEAELSLFNYYEHCMPLAIIVFNELVKCGKIPIDINAWILDLFTSGIIKAGEIESKVNQILSGYSTKFFEVWIDELE